MATASGLLDGRPDPAVVVLGGAGLALLVVVALVVSRTCSRAARRRGVERGPVVGAVALGTLLPVALLALAFVAEAVVAPVNSSLVPLS